MVGYPVQEGGVGRGGHALCLQLSRKHCSWSLPFFDFFDFFDSVVSSGRDSISRENSWFNAELVRMHDDTAT